MKRLDPTRQLTYGIEEEPEKSEAQIQGECVFWYNNEYANKISFASECLISVHNNADNGASGAIALSLGRKKGASDLLYFGYNKRILCIEMKDRTGTQKKDQKAWEESLWMRGFEYVLCRCLEQFKFIITGHDKGLNEYELEIGWHKHCIENGIDKLTGEKQ